MSGVNLSDWALKSGSLVVYMMIIAVVAGGLFYFRLGRNEDPAFIIKTMVVQAAWPGASVEETMKQVTERLERRLQETPHLDFLRSFTRAGVSTVFVNLKGSASAREVTDTWYHVRKSIGDMRHTLPAGVIGPGFNDEFGDTFGIIYGFTSDGFSQRELRDRVEDIRSRLLLVPDVSKIELLGEQDEVIFVEFSTKELAALGVDRSALIAALQSQNIVRPAGTIQTSADSISIRVSGGFQSERDIADINFSASGRMLRLSDIARVRRGYTDPPHPMFRVNGKPAIGLAIAMRDGGDILALGANITKAMAQITADLPIGIEPSVVADQPVVVNHAIREFMVSLLQAIAIIMVVSFISLGVRPGLIIALAIPFTLAIVLPIMGLLSIDMQRISLGALIIALALLVDDAMTTTDATLTKLAEGAGKVEAATFAYRTHAMAMLAGTLVTIAGFIPVGFAASSAGEYTFSLFAVVTIALLVSWVRRGHFHAAAWRCDPRPAQARQLSRPGQDFPDLPQFPNIGDAREMADHYDLGGALRRLGSGDADDPAAVLSLVGSAGATGRCQPASERFDLRERSCGEAPRYGARERPRCGAVEHLRRTGCDPLLSAPQRPAPERLLHADRRDREGCRRTRTPAFQA
ncbi:multidrug efflux pump subunit AcrB [Bradyrhizobium sp. LM6.10]